MPRQFPGFTLQFPLREIQAWAAKYDYASDDDAFAAGRKILQGDRSPETLKIIVKWKSHRRADLIDLNEPHEIKEALQVAVGAQNARTAFGALMGLEGVQVPMASAILRAINQEEYTVIDWRSLHALGAKDWPITLHFYLRHYAPECKRLANASGVDLRTTDRALWAWSAAH